MTTKEIIEKLEADGWVECPSRLLKNARDFYRRFDTPTQCYCNNDKPGMQVCCSVSEYQGNVTYELELNGELHDGTWIKLHQWILPNDIEKGLALIPRMLATWEFIAQAAKEKP